MRNLREAPKLSARKSSDQRALRCAAAVIGVRDPLARLRPRRRFFALTGAHDVACISRHTMASDFTIYTCSSFHEHREADLVRKHLDEGIRYIDSCLACHCGVHGGHGEIEQGDDNV